MKRMAIGAVVVMLLAVILVGIGYKAGSDSTRLAIQETADAVEQRTAKRISAIKVVRQTINGQVREVVRENTVYRECLVDPDLQRLLNSAREGKAVADSIMPAAGSGAAP